MGVPAARGTSDGHDVRTIAGRRCKVASLPQGPPLVGFRAPASSPIRPMHDQHTTTALAGLRIYEDDRLIFDGSDPTTYTVCQSADDIAAALASNDNTEDPDDPAR